MLLESGLAAIGRFFATWSLVALGLAAMSAAWPRQSRAATRLWRCGLACIDRSLLFTAFPVIVAGLLVLWTHGGFPHPRIHDEFSYLLASDTFARGRLANPPHPLWQSFETFHVNQQPSYVSMYQPGVGMLLAIGQRFLGHPWFAVWLSVIGLTAAIHWAARAWLPPPWAAAAGLVAGCIAARGYWLDSYWGGALPAIGGALVVGGWPRLVHAAGRGGASVVRATFPLAAGGLILLMTRPYEGLSLVLPVAVALAATRLRLRTHAAWIATCAAILAVGLGVLAFYNSRTTGRWLVSPYALNLADYHHRRIFVFGSDRDPPPEYHHDMMRRLYSEEFALQPFSRSAIRTFLLPAVSFYAAPLQLFTLAALPWLVRSRRFRPLLAATGCVCLAVLLTVFVRPHYLAPAAAGIVILTMQAFRVVSTARWRRLRVGRVVACGFVACWLAVAWVDCLTQRARATDGPEWVRARAAIGDALTRSGGRHLVFVRYAPTHSPHDEWVFNGADMGATAPVLWARSLDAAADARLMRHEVGRTAWLIEPDVDCQLRRLTPEAATDGE